MTRANDRYVLKRWWSRIWLVLVLFILMFSPPLFPKINSLIILTGLVSVLLAVNYRKDVKSLLKTMPRKYFFMVMLFFGYMIAIMAISYLQNGHTFIRDYLITVYRFGLIGCVLLVIAYIIVFCQRYDFNKIDLLEMVVMAVALQLIIGILALLLPNFKRLLVDIMYANTGDVIFLNRYHFERRFYGFANNLLDTFGYGMGVATALVPIVAFAKKRYWQLLLVPGFLLLSFFNARTGLLIGIVGLLFSMTSVFVYGTKKVRLAICIVILSIVGIMMGAIPILKAKTPQVYYWLYHDINSVIGFITKKPNKSQTMVRDNTAATLFKVGFWKLPQGAELVFGTGHSVYSVDGYQHSDVGYVNDFWLMGIVGSVLLMVIIISAAVDFAKHDKTLLFMALFLIVALMIFQVKARAIMASFGFIASMLIVASGILPSYHWKRRSK